MFSRFGRIFSIDVDASKQAKYNAYWVTVFRSTKPVLEGLTVDEMHVNHCYPTSRATIARLRRAQDRLMEGTHDN